MIHFADFDNDSALFIKTIEGLRCTGEAQPLIYSEILTLAKAQARLSLNITPFHVFECPNFIGSCLVREP